MQKESGFTLLGMGFTILLVVCIAYLVAILFPVYYDNITLNRLLHDTLRDARVNQSSYAIRQALAIRMQVASINIPSRDIKIQRSANGDHFQIMVQYTKVIPLVYNMSLQIRFSDKAG